MVKKICLTIILFFLIFPSRCYSSTVEVVWIKMNDNAETPVVVDAGSGSNNGTLVGGDNTSAKTEAGHINEALHMNGTDDAIQLDGLVTELANYTTGTVNYWVKIDVDAGAFKEGFNIMRDNVSNPGTYWHFTFDMTAENDRIWTSFWVDGTEQWDWTGAANQLDALIGNYAMITIVHNGTSPKFYINAVDVTAGGSFNVSTDLTKWWKALLTDATNKADNCNFGIEEYGGTDYYPFDGPLDETRVFDQALTQEQIDLIFSAGVGTETSLNDLGSSTASQLIVIN